MRIERVRPRASLLVAVAAFAGGFLLTSCRKVVDSLAVVQLAEHTASVAVGGSIPLELLAVDPPGYVPDVKWSSSDPATASVRGTSSLSAEVDGLRPGQVRIIVAGGGSADTALVSVLATPAGVRR